MIIQYQSETMEHKNIKSYEDLLLNIEQLKAARYNQEKMLQADIQHFVSSINPVDIAKETVQKLAGNQEVRTGLIKLGLGIGSTVLINQLIGKHRILPIFIGIKLVENIVGLIGKKLRPKIES
jgi:uncharacterized membrane protein